jgi:hypothetical protein
MVSDSRKTIVAIIVVAMLLAASTPFLVDARADGMSLKAGDIGPYWQMIFSDSKTFNDTNMSSPVSLEDVWFGNKTWIVISELQVFKSPEASMDMLHLFTRAYLSVENANVGDSGIIYRFGGNAAFAIVSPQGYGFHFNSSNVVGLMFVKGDVFASIIVAKEGYDALAHSWIHDFIIDLGMIQLQKIDRYLGY